MYNINRLSLSKQKNLSYVLKLAFKKSTFLIKYYINN